MTVTASFEPVKFTSRIANLTVRIQVCTVDGKFNSQFLNDRFSNIEEQLLERNLVTTVPNAPKVEITAVIVGNPTEYLLACPACQYYELCHRTSANPIEVGPPLDNH